MKFEEVKILEMKCSIVMQTDKAGEFIQVMRKELGEIGISRGGDSPEQGGCLISIHIPPSQKEKLYNLLRDFCKKHDLLLSEETLK